MTIDTEIKYILSLQAVRERAQRVFQLAEANQINHFEYHEDRFDAAVQYVANIIKVYTLQAFLATMQPQADLI